MQQGNTKERIVEAYIELESERPVEKITVTALVERSRITRKTFYYYFKDIYDLMEYRMEREMKRIMEETMSQPDPEKALTQLYMYIMENQKHIRALSESVQFMALRRQMGEKVYQYFYNHLERIGMFKNLTMPEAAMAVQIIIFSVMGVAFGMSQAIFLYTGFMDGISRNLDEAAIIDGCNNWQLLWKILFPVCKPIIATEAIFVFIYGYSELVFSMILMTDTKYFTVSRAMLNFSSAHTQEIGSQFAYVVMSVIPMIIIYIVFHKQIEKGMLSGAIKG